MVICFPSIGPRQFGKFHFPQNLNATALLRIRMSFIARYVYTYEEFVLVTEAPQCDRMTVTRQDTDNQNNNIQIYKIDDVQK